MISEVEAEPHIYACILASRLRIPICIILIVDCLYTRGGCERAMGDIHDADRPDIESQRDPLIGRIIENKYHLESLISKGGMGSVYTARRNRIGDFVAVKVLKIGEVFDRVTLKRFQLEAAASASIRHQNVISIYDFGLLDDIAYLVMEKLEGPPLSSELAAYGTCSPERSIRIFKQIAAAVAAAHKQGIIHRDLKPSNIIFQYAGCVDDQLKVVDFGLAKLIRVQNPDDKITVENATVGTPSYMSPEQCLGHKLDERSDIYSLGVLLFEMLTGDLPFTDFSISKIMIKHVTQAPPSMRSINPDIPEEIDAVVLKALEKIPEKRYRSAIEMATEFELACRNSILSKQRESRMQNGSAAFYSLNVTLSEMTALMNDVAASSRTTAQVPMIETKIPAPLKFSFERFVGRSDEIAQIKERFESVKSDASRTVFVIGDPGVGKTELICQFRKQLKPNEALFLSGKFYEYGSDGPYRPYLDGIYNFTRSIKKYSPEGWAQSDSTGLIDGIERGLDEIERLIEGSKKGSSEEQIKYLVFEKLTKIFTTISSSSPLILFLDDVQWADSNSLEFLAYLIRNTEKDRILTLCTARAQDAFDAVKPFKSWLNRISRYSGCDQIRLGPLNEIEIRKLIDSIFGVIKISEAVVRRFYETTQGNPFYLGEIIRQLIQEQRIDWTGERWECADIDKIELPSSILELVELRLRRLSDEALDAFTRAAVVGEKFSFQLLRAVTEISQDALMEIIDIGLREFIIKESAVSLTDQKELEKFSDDVFIFCHSTIRKALYERLSSFRRCRLHSQIANRLENLNSRKLDRNAGELAYHFYYGSNHRKALYYSRAAGETARGVFAMEEATKYFSWAEESFNQMLEAEEDHGCEPEWIGEFRLSYGSVLTHLGKNENAGRQLDAALDLSRKHGLAKLEGGTLHALGELSWSCGAYKDAIEFSESALAFAREFGDSKRECRILGLIGDTYFSQGRFDQAIEHYTLSLETALIAGCRFGEGAALRRLGSTMGIKGQADCGIENLEKALAIARETGDRQNEWLVLMNIGNILLHRDETRRAAEYYRRSFAVARSIGRRRGECRVALNMGELCRRQEDFHNAAYHFKEACTIAAEVQDREIEGHALSNLGLVYRVIGESDKAMESFSKALNIFREINYRSDAEIESLCGIGEILLKNDRADEAKQYFVSAVKSGRELGLKYLAVLSLHNLADCEKALRDPLAARASLIEALDLIKHLTDNEFSVQDRRRYEKIEFELTEELTAIEEFTYLKEEFAEFIEATNEKRLVM